MNKNPVFITGVYRSGTTILSRMLDAHPDMNIAYDSINYFRWYLKTNTPPKDYKKIVHEVGDRLLNRYNKKIDCIKIINNISKYGKIITHKQIYSSIMDDYMGYEEKRWGEKTVLEWTSIPKFFNMFSGGKALHIIRDPRDVVSSYKNMTFESKDRYFDSIFACMHSMDTAIEYKKKLPKSKYYIVHYEELVKNPKCELIKICKFLEIKYDHEMVNPDKYIDNQGGKLTLETQSSYIDGVDKLPIGRWRDKLDSTEVAFIEGFLFDNMRVFGYKPSKSSLELNKIIKIIKNESLLIDRVVNYLKGGGGIEE